MSDGPRIFGASIRGPLHAERGQPNEDAWLACRGRFGTLITVSDGVGSKPQARLGARSACWAARQAVRAWDTSSAHDLPHLVERAWLHRLRSTPPADAAATCIMALAEPSGRLLVLGVGDGMAVVRRRGQGCRWVIGPRADGFASDTEALGLQPTWRIESWEGQGEAVVVLATDGVSDDLLPERVDDFLDWLVDEFGRMDIGSASRALRAELYDWPTPRHLDDKTIAVLWVTECGGSP